MDTEEVTLRELLESEAWRKAEGKMALPLALGSATSGEEVVFDLASLQHLFIAGDMPERTNLENALLTGLLMARGADTMRLQMIDFSQGTRSAYNQFPQRLAPLADNPTVALGVLRWLELERKNRRQQFRQQGVRNIASFNRSARQPLPSIVVWMNELADLLRRSDEASILLKTLLSLNISAVGIHVIATTRYSALGAIPNTLKANLPSRIALRLHAPRSPPLHTPPPQATEHRTRRCGFLCASRPPWEKRRPRRFARLSPHTSKPSPGMRGALFCLSA